MDDTLPAAGQLTPEWLDLFIVLGSIILVVLVIFFWALLFRKSGGRRHRPGHHQRRAGYRKELKKGAEGIKELIQQHRHRRRHEHRPTNTTLAESGGLPPIRGKKSPPPQP